MMQHQAGMTYGTKYVAGDWGRQLPCATSVQPTSSQGVPARSDHDKPAAPAEGLTASNRVVQPTTSPQQPTASRTKCA